MHIMVIQKGIGALSAALIMLVPFFTAAWVDYGAYYRTPAPYSQLYYQPMYAYAYAPVQSSQNTYISYPQQNYAFAYGAPSYGYHPQYQYSQYPSSYGSGYGYGMYDQPVPYSYGYPTGDTVPWTGGPLCEFPDYNGRALCGSNPNQWIYDPWTGSWY